jgi:hypothetical protein
MELTCSKCFGNKTYRGMGSMIVKCEPCGGSGKIQIKSELPPVEPEKKAAKGKPNAKEKGDGKKAS